MLRRHLLGSLAAGFTASHAAAASNAPKFKLRYGPHPGMFENSAGKDIIDQIKFAADQGFTGWEDNGAMNRAPELQDRIGAELARHGMKMGVFVSFSDFKTSEFVTRTDRDYQDTLRAVMRKAVETAKRTNAVWHTVVPAAVNQKLDPGFQTANCITNLRVMTEICEPAKVVMVLEPLNWYANHPGLFLRTVPQTYAICKAVNSPSCKILDDLYHQQIAAT
jgi:hydroxypyruvate isomerase